MADVIWEEWVSTLSPNTCQTCRSLHGKLFRQGEGPQPPLHRHCRCYRRYHHTERVQDNDPGEGLPPMPTIPPAPLPPAPTQPPRPRPGPPLPPLPLPFPLPGDDEDDEEEDEDER